MAETWAGLPQTHCAVAKKTSEIDGQVAEQLAVRRRDLVDVAGMRKLSSHVAILWRTCLACYRYLITRHSYAHDFNDLAQHWRDFDRAIAHWKEIYPGRVREQVYENLIADSETQIRELLEFCDLSFENACLNFHQTNRRINTLSASQVREPLRKDTARAAKYGSLLDPLRTALGLPLFKKKIKYVNRRLKRQALVR